LREPHGPDFSRIVLIDNVDTGLIQTFKNTLFAALQFIELMRCDWSDKETHGFFGFI